MNLIDILFQIKVGEKREIVSRWLATLIARPGNRRCTSASCDQQGSGVGKTTLADLMKD